MPYLEIKLGPDTLLVPFVGRIDYVIGRLPKADIQLRDMKVSRMHTQLFIDSRGSAFVRDLGSSGGTYYGNQRMRKGLIAPMVDGTKIRIGDAKITFYDAEPPSNAIEPPSQSDPRGLVRTNPRPRHFEAEATVLAADRVDPDTHSGPAEPPPEIDPMVFADGPLEPSGKQPAASSAAMAKPSSASAAKPPSGALKPPTKKRDTGIVEAPWEKRDVVAGPKSDRKLTVPPPTGGVPSPAGAQRRPPNTPAAPAMPTSGYDETGAYREEVQQAPAAPQARSPLPPRQPGAPVPPSAKPLPPAAAKPAPLPPRAVPPAPAKPPADFVARSDADRGSDPFDRPDESDLAESVDDLDGPALVENSPFVISNFSAPKAPPADSPDADDAQPKLGMPTVRLERPAMLERQAARAAKDEEAADEVEEAPKIPTASITRAEAAAAAALADDEPAPMIGVPPEKPPAAGAEVASEEDELTDEQIAEYLGGSASGRYGEVDFDAGRVVTSDTEDPPVEDDARSSGDEVAFHVSRVDLDAPDEFDIDDEPSSAPAAAGVEGSAANEASEEVIEEVSEEVPAPEAPPVVEASTAKLRATTLLNVEPVTSDDAPAEEAPAEEAPVEEAPVEEAPVEEVPAEEAPDEEASVAEEPVDSAPVDESPAAQESAQPANTYAELTEAAATPAEEIPSYDKHETPPPVVREGASADRAFQPRKTRKLMKRRTATLDKSTDKTLDRDNPPRGEPTRVLGDPPQPTGAKTMFVPKPENMAVSRPADAPPEMDEDETGRAMSAAAQHGRKLDDMGHGPGGDTVALPPNMMNELRAELAKQSPGKPKNEPPTIGDSPTVRNKQADDEDEEEFILDDNYSFFTPPPPTRKGAYKQPKHDDVIDASDFLGESEKLPPDKKAKAKDDPDTLVE